MEIILLMEILIKWKLRLKKRYVISISWLFIFRKYAFEYFSFMRREKMSLKQNVLQKSITTLDNFGFQWKITSMI